MRAILRMEFGGPDVLVIREIPEPEPKEGHAVIRVEAFGLNHAELHMRKGEWAEIAAGPAPNAGNTRAGAVPPRIGPWARGKDRPGPILFAVGGFDLVS